MTAPETLSTPLAAPVHEHAWVTESAHLTSEGRIRYVRCTGCRARRVDLDPASATPPLPISRAV
ncbi:MAG: hypothetical protein K0S37_100 [Microbacterium sp.]|jgi:hypothetical protein|nr:hypothetical protein [Microbacterium sp.]